MAPKNDSAKETKQTSKNQVHPTHKIRDDPTDDEFSDFMEEYPTPKLIKP